MCHISNLRSSLQKESPPCPQAKKEAHPIQLIDSKEFSCHHRLLSPLNCTHVCPLNLSDMALSNTNQQSLSTLIGCKQCASISPLQPVIDQVKHHSHKALSSILLTKVIDDQQRVVPQLVKEMHHRTIIHGLHPSLFQAAIRN